VGDVVACVSAAIPTKVALLPPDVASYCAGVLRNLSCDAAFHVALVEPPPAALIQTLFDVGDDATKEDVAVSVCNIFMGNINSTALLARGVLPLVLWLCASRASPDSRALGTTVVRKLALAPGNAQPLVDGSVISHLALLMEDCKSSRFVQTNCIATFCCVARKPGVAALLASYGVIANVLELLEGQHVSEPLVEAMCVDLLSTLAAFARADDPVESKLASVLYGLIESDDGSLPASHGHAGKATAPSWQTDRAFLSRDAASLLPPPTLSSAHERVATKPPTLRHTLYPIRFPGYAVDVPPMASTIEVRTIEQIVPSVAVIGEACAANTVAVAGGSHMPATPSRFDFSPMPMFAKHREPFAALSSMPPDQHRQPQ
jgi:hypothetical protein